MTESMFFVEDTDAVCNIPYKTEKKVSIRMDRISEAYTPSENSVLKYDDSIRNSALLRLNPLSKTSPYNNY